MTPRQIFLLMTAVLLISAVCVGVLVGGTGDPFDGIVGAREWMIGVGLILVGSVVCGVFNWVGSRIVGLVLCWALGETGVEAIRVLGYAVVVWLGVMLLVAVTWAWLGHGSAWRVAPKQWLVSGGVVYPDGRGQLAVGFT